MTRINQKELKVTKAYDHSGLCYFLVAEIYLKQHPQPKQ